MRCRICGSSLRSALASRRRLLDALNVRNGQTLWQLCEVLDMTRQAVTKHLAVLEDAGGAARPTQPSAPRAPHLSTLRGSLAGGRGVVRPLARCTDRLRLQPREKQII